MYIRILMLAVLLGVVTQMRGQERNYVAISSDNMASIVKEAAKVTPSDRQYRWQQQELTAFLHFGVNTFTDKEWGDGTEKERVFNPVHLNAEQWIKALKDGGFKCAILTCKHHDGFCLWPSAYTEHSVKNSPWKDGKGDVVREVSDACRKYGMGFGVYLSPWDRNSKLYGTEEYNDYFCNQLRELLTNYGEVSEVWFDGACGEGPNGKKQVYDFVRWYKMIRELQPNAVIASMGPDVRWVGTETGRGRETEWSVVPNKFIDPQTVANNSQKEMILPPLGDLTNQDLGSRDAISTASGLCWYPAETDVSIRPGWFWHEKENDKVKSADELMDIYFTSVGRNGVLLLNVPPNKDGLLSDGDVKSLNEFKELKDRIFANNLLDGAKGWCSKPECYMASSRSDLSSNVQSYSSNNDSVSTAWETVNYRLVYNFKLKHAVCGNVLELQEDIRKGQHVEKFVFECKNDEGEWQKIVEGTTIGFKRLIRFDKVSGKEFRLMIVESRAVPFVSQVELYME